MGFNKLSEVLNKLRGQYPGFSKRLREAEAVSRWEKAVGPAIAKHARAIRVQDEILWVEVDHPIWKSELHHRKRQILDILNGAIQSAARPPNQAEKPAGVIKDLLLLDVRGEARPGSPQLGASKSRSTE